MMPTLKQSNNGSNESILRSPIQPHVQIIGKTVDKQRNPTNVYRVKKEFFNKIVKEKNTP
jgi:hypothetical protein